jgi:hypothetical protein
MALRFDPFELGLNCANRMPIVKRPTDIDYYLGRLLEVQ